MLQLNKSTYHVLSNDDLTTLQFEIEINMRTNIATIGYMNSVVQSLYDQINNFTAPMEDHQQILDEILRRERFVRRTLDAFSLHQEKFDEIIYIRLCRSSGST